MIENNEVNERDKRDINEIEEEADRQLEDLSQNEEA